MEMSSLEKPVGLSSLVSVGSRAERATRTLQARFLELVDKVRQTRPASDIELLRRAYEFAAEQHRAQLRKSGDPYLSHPLEVAHILADMKLDITTLCAALLHDVVEDTRISSARIAERFGSELAQLVEGVTKISRLDLLAPEALIDMRDLHATRASMSIVRDAAAGVDRPLIVNGAAKDLTALSPSAGRTLASLNEFERISGLTESPDIAAWLKA